MLIDGLPQGGLPHFQPFKRQVIESAGEHPGIRGNETQYYLIHFNLIESVYKGDAGSPGKLEGLAFRVIKNRTEHQLGSLLLNPNHFPWTVSTFRYFDQQQFSS